MNLGDKYKMVPRKGFYGKINRMDDDAVDTGNFQASDVQSWWEIPCIAHFCSLFRLYFELVDFDIEELEEALLTDGVADSGSSILQDLIVRLLTGCYSTCKDEITSSNYQMYLRRLFRMRCEENPTIINPFDDDVAFHTLSVRTKLDILLLLCDCRLDNEDVADALKTLEAANLRVEPLGQDSGGSTYWYFYGTRLYREDYSLATLSQPPKKRGKRKPDLKHPSQIQTKWQVVCYTEQDWQVLTQKFKNCKTEHEQRLHKILHDDFLPELPRLFAEKEKLQRRRMLEQQLRWNNRSNSVHVDKEEAGGDASKSSAFGGLNGCSTNGSGGVNSASSIPGTSSGSTNGLLGGNVGLIVPNRIRVQSKHSLPAPTGITSIKSILDKRSVVGLGAITAVPETVTPTSASTDAVSTAEGPPSTCTSSKAISGGYNENSWCQDNDDDNNNKINTMDLDEEHSERECSPADADEEELRRQREEQERADRLLAEAIEREERKARLHLRERRGGTFSSPSNAGSRNSSSVSTERPQSIRTVSKQTIAAAVNKKNTKASPVKASPVKKKSGGKSKSGKKNGRMTNNSLSVSLSPLVDEDEDGEEDGDGSEKKKKKKKKRKHHVENTGEEDDSFERPEEDESESHDMEVTPKKKSKSLKLNSPKKVAIKKKKKYISSKTVNSSRSPSPSPPPKKVKKTTKTSPVMSKKKLAAHPEDDDDDEVHDEQETENHMDIDEEDEDDDFVEEEEEADYESIVARTLHNNNNNKLKGKTGKDKVKTKEKVKSKEKKRLSEDRSSTSPEKKPGASKKSKKLDKLLKTGKVKESSGKVKSSKSDSSANLIGASTVGGGTSKTKVKGSVLFSQSEEDVQIGMHKVIESIKNHRDAWPFINPVDEDYAPNYYKIIDHPMDLQTMEDKLDNQEYSSLDEFKSDFARIVDNCRKYNGPANEYTEMVETVEQAFNKLVQRYIVPDESDEEISIEYTNSSNSDRKRPSSKPSSKKKEKEAGSISVGDSDGNNLTMKEHKKENEPKSPNKKLSAVKAASIVSPSKSDPKEKEKLERKKKKQQLMRHHSRDSEAIENLASVSAETLKDINKWLGDTPKPPETYGETKSLNSQPPQVNDKTSKKASEANADVKPKGTKTLPTTNSALTSPVIKDKKTKKLLSSTLGGASSGSSTSQKRKLDFSGVKKARSTQFIMDEDDEYNIDRDLSPPPPKITKKPEDNSVVKKGVKKNKPTTNKDGKNDESSDGKVGKVKGKKDKHHHHHHKHHHHHHHHHKRDGSSAEKDSTPKPSAPGNKPKFAAGSSDLKKSLSMSSSSSVSSMSTNSSTVPPKPKMKKTKASTDETGGPPVVKKPKGGKRAGGGGNTGNLLNTLKNSAAFKRMNQISRATKVLSSAEANKLKSEAQGGAGPSQAAGPASTEGASANASSSGTTAGDSSSAGEKKKCLLVSDLPEDKDGGPKLSLGSVLSTDAIKLVDLKENDDELSETDEFAKAKTEEMKPSKDGVEKKEEEEEAEEEEVDRKLEPSKGFNRERCMPNLSAWIKAFGGPVKAVPGTSGTTGSGSTSVSTVSTISPLVSPVKKLDPDCKNKFRVMGRGVGEPESKSHNAPMANKTIAHPIPHHPSVIKTSSSIPSSSPTLPGVRHHPSITEPLGPTWSPLTPISGPSPTSLPSNPLINPIKQAALAAAERSGSNIGEDLSSPPRSHSHHTSKRHRNRKMSSSSFSSQSESGSPLCVTSTHDGIGSSAGGSYITSGGSVVNPPRWVDDHPWGPVSQSQSPSASSHVSSQSPAGPNSPFSPSVASPPPTAPQTPPRPPAPVRVGFYQDITQHSSPEKLNESQSSPATPPTPNSVHGSAGSGGSASANSNAGGSRRGGGSSGANRDSTYPASATSHYAPRYVASTPSPNIVGGPGSNASSGLPSPSTPASNTSGGIAESPGNPNSPHSPKVVNMSSNNSSGGNGGGSNSSSSSGPADYRSHGSTNATSVITTSSSASNGPQTPAHQHSNRSGATSVLHSSSPYGTPSSHHFSSSSIMETHLRASAGSHQLPDPAHSHHHHSPSPGAHSHHHQTPAHAHSNAPQTSHPAHAHSMSHLGQPQQAHAGSAGGNQYHDTSSSRYPPNLPHAHQQSSVASTSASASSSYSTSTSSNHQNLSHAHAQSRQPTSQPHLSHPYPSNPYTSNPRSLNLGPNVYNNPISSDPAMNRYYKAMAAAASASGAGSELSLTIASNPGGSSSTTSTGTNNTTSSSSSTKRSSRSNASANKTPSPHPEIPRSASVNPTAAAAVAAAALEGKLGPADLANGFWPHNLASLTQIVNSIPGAYRHYAADPESMSKFQRAAAAAAAAQQESNSYPAANSNNTSGGVITSGSGSKSSVLQTSGGSSSHLHNPHHSSSSDKGSGGSSNSEISHHHHHHHHSDTAASIPNTGSSSKKQSKSSESKASRSQSSSSGKSSSSSGGGIVPGSAFNFSSLTPDTLALYSKEMSDAATSSLYSASPPTLTPPLAHRASEFYPTASSASHFTHHSSFSAAARSSTGGVPTPPITPYPFMPGSHPSPYQAHQPVSSQPFAAHSQSSRGLDAYQQLFQGSPHVMGLLSHPSGYPAPYAHPSSLGFNRPGGWI